MAITNQKPPKINDPLNVAMHALDKARYEAAATARTDMRSNGLQSSTVAGDQTSNPYASGPPAYASRNGYFARMLAPTLLPQVGLAGWPVCRGLTNTATHVLP
jgi:hypothetical protein